MSAVRARLDLIRREMLGSSPAHDAALRLLQAKLAKHGKKVRCWAEDGEVLHADLNFVKMALGIPFCMLLQLSLHFSSVLGRHICPPLPQRYCPHHTRSLYPRPGPGQHARRHPAGLRPAIVS